MLKTSWITNPFYVYILSFLLVFLIYTLGWSTAFPPISTSTIVFFSITFLISFIIAYPISLQNKRIIFNIPESKQNQIILIFIALGYILEFIYNRGVPIILIFKKIPYLYTSFGIPTFHVFLHTFTSFYGIYLFHQFLSTRKKRLLFYFLYSLIPHILVFNRGSLLMVLTAILFVYLISIKRLRFKIVISLLLLSLGFFYIFGYLGNIRSANGDDAYIPKMSRATESFLDSKIPNEYFWLYAYIASPMANLQHNINNQHINPSLASYICLFRDEILFDFISKRLPNSDRCYNKPNLVLKHFNVSTVYSASYSLVGWPGPYIMFLFSVIMTFFYLSIISPNSKYYVTGLAILLTIFVFNTFSNMWPFSGLSFQLIYPLIGHLISQKRKNRRISS